MYKVLMRTLAPTSIATAHVIFIPSDKLTHAYEQTLILRLQRQLTPKGVTRLGAPKGTYD
jgi:hypothetical protein